MKKIFTYIYKYIGEILTAFGSGLFLANIIGFANRGGLYYYYAENQFFAGAGLSILIIGIFILRNKKKNPLA